MSTISSNIERQIPSSSSSFYKASSNVCFIISAIVVSISCFEEALASNSTSSFTT